MCKAKNAFPGRYLADCGADTDGGRPASGKSAGIRLNRYTGKDRHRIKRVSLPPDSPDDDNHPPARAVPPRLLI